MSLSDDLFQLELVFVGEYKHLDQYEDIGEEEKPETLTR